jgi:hypothetical protein
MKKILLFEEYLTEYFGEVLNEASMEDLGFAALLGSTDKQNLGDAASNIGIEKNMTYTIKINGIKDMIDLGTKKSYEGFSGITKGSSVGDKIDSISVTSKGETKQIPQKISSAGNIILDFDNSPIDVTAANNGMLAFLRACTAASQVFVKGGVDPQKVKGKLLISMGNAVSGDASRNAAFLAVSNDISGTNDNVRIARSTYEDTWIPRIESNPGKVLSALKENDQSSLILGELFEQENMEDGSSLIKLVGDSLADSIRAAIFQYSSERRNVFPNNSGSYAAFKSIYRKMLDLQAIKDAKPSTKKTSEVILSMLMETAISDLASGYPMKMSGNVNTPSFAKDILSKLGNEKATNLNHKPLEDFLSQYKPDNYSKIPQFNPVIGDFWRSITSAVVLRTAATFSKNASSPMRPETEAAGKEVKGEEKSGSKQNVSGGV